MPPTLSIVKKIAYGSGDIGFSMTSTIAAAFFAIFLTDVVGLSPGIAAIAIFLGRTWDYLNDPLIGHISDRTRTRWGRRRPFLLFGALPFALAFTLLWWRPPFDHPVVLAGYYSVAYLLFDSAATFVYMPYFALTPELTPDYDERTALTSYRMFFSIAGSLAAFTIPIMLVGTFTPPNVNRVLMMGAIFGIVSALPLWIVFFSTREQGIFMQQKPPALRESMRAALHNRPFVFGAVIFLLTWVAMGLLEANLLYFIKYILRREGESDLIMAVIFVTAIIALPFWNWTSRRLDKRRAYIAGVSFWAVVQIAIITQTATSAFGGVLFLCVLAGIGVSAAHVLPWSIMPDAIEWGELQSGERHEGMFYSLVTLAQKIASSIAIPLSLLLLEATGYIPNVAEQPASAALGIRLVVGPIPALLLCSGILFAWFYPLGRVEYNRLNQDLKARRSEGDGEEKAS